MILVIVLALLGVALGVYVIFLARQDWSAPAELRGEWWTEFEREFRAYADRVAEVQSRRRHGRGAPGAPGD